MQRPTPGCLQSQVSSSTASKEEERPPPLVLKNSFTSVALGGDGSKTSTLATVMETSSLARVLVIKRKHAMVSFSPLVVDVVSRPLRARVFSSVSFRRTRFPTLLCAPSSPFGSHAAYTSIINVMGWGGRISR